MSKRSELKAQIRKHWRLRYKEEMERTGEPLPADFLLEEPTDGDLEPPTAQRVAQRAAVLSAVALRGLASTWAHAEQVEFLPNLMGWLNQSGLDSEVEPDEAEILLAPASELDQRSSIDACWRWEGAAVLVAALGRLELPPHDQMIDTRACGEACGLFNPRSELDARLAGAAFASAFDVDAYANRALALHWRLRQFVQIEQMAIDFADFAAGVEWANFDLRGVDLIDGDLAIGGKPIAQAEPEAVSTAMSIASERHHAANWLIGWSPVYGEVECPT